MPNHYVVHLKVLQYFKPTVCQLKISKQINLNMICVLERLEGTPAAHYALAFESEASQTKVIILIQTSFNIIKHSVIKFS